MSSRSDVAMSMYWPSHSARQVRSQPDGVAFKGQLHRYGRGT